MMKLSFYGHDVDIKARFISGSNDYNDEDTAFLVNQVAEWIREASEYNKEHGFNIIAESYDKAYGEITNGMNIRKLCLIQVLYAELWPERELLKCSDCYLKNTCPDKEDHDMEHMTKPTKVEG